MGGKRKFAASAIKLIRWWQSGRWDVEASSRTALPKEGRIAVIRCRCHQFHTTATQQTLTVISYPRTESPAEWRKAAFADPAKDLGNPPMGQLFTMRVTLVPMRKLPAHNDKSRFYSLATCLSGRTRALLPLVRRVTSVGLAMIPNR